MDTLQYIGTPTPAGKFTKNAFSKMVLDLNDLLLFYHWITVLGTPKECPAPQQFRFFEFDPPTVHSNDQSKNNPV